MENILFSEIKRIESIVQSDKKYISLSQGALKVGGVPTEIKQFSQQILLTDKADYYQSAWGILSLREKLSEILSKKNNVDLSYENIVVTHGCAGAISALFLALLERGDEVIIPEPNYLMYTSMAKLVGAKKVFVQSLDLDELESVRTNKTKILVFSNPCNPTGEIVLKEQIEKLARWCEKNKIYLIVDEAYDDYIFTKDFFSSTSLVTQSEYIVRTGSFSKSLSMSGWRVGYAVMPKKLTFSIGATQDTLLNCPNVLAQHAVLYALDHPQYAQKFHDMVRQSRDVAIEALQPLVEKNIFSFTIPQAGFYLFLQTNVLQTNEQDTSSLCKRILDEAQVGLIPGGAFGPSGKSFIRLCYARKPEVVRDGIMRIKRFFGVS
jgi:aspartate/methionine/tyrosine aminotransferase